VTSSTLLADPPSNETIDVFYINKLSKYIKNNNDDDDNNNNNNS